MKTRRNQRGGIWTKERRDVLAHRFTNCDNLPTDTYQKRTRKIRCKVDNKRDEWNVHYYHPYRIYDEDKIQTIKDQLSVLDQAELQYLMNHLRVHKPYQAYQESRKSNKKGASTKKVSKDTPNTEKNPFTEVKTKGKYVQQGNDQLLKLDPTEKYVLAHGEKLFSA